MVSAVKAALARAIRVRTLAGLALPALLACGCNSMNHTEEGALAGGAIGAGAGALAGAAVRNPGIGAAIGAGVGAITGAIIGKEADDDDKRRAAAVAAAQAPHGLSVADVIQMAHSQLSDAVIINQIRTTGTVFDLTPNDLAWLKQNTVSDAVVAEMQATRYRTPRAVYVADPAYVQPVYVADPYPPPVRVGIGFGYGRRW